MKEIAKSNWKLHERGEGESIAFVVRGPFQGLEIAVDWTQGWIRPATKKERLLSIVSDKSLVAEHQRLFLEERGEGK